MKLDEHDADDPEDEVADLDGEDEVDDLEAEVVELDGEDEVDDFEAEVVEPLLLPQIEQASNGPQIQRLAWCPSVVEKFSLSCPSPKMGHHTRVPKA